jgi:apolipoprotein N-acyltransferase
MPRSLSAVPFRGFSWLACALSGALMVLSFAPIYWWWCGWVAFAPAWLALRLDPGVRGKPFRHGYLMGFVLNAGCFWWLGSASLPAVAVVSFFLPVYLGTWFLLCSRCLPLAGPASQGIRALLWRVGAGAALWVTLEWIHSWFLFRLNWNELGISQTPCADIRQLAALGGVPLLSWMLTAFGLLIAEALLAWRAGKAIGWLAAAVAGVLAFSSWTYGWVHLQRHWSESPTHEINYFAVQPNIPEIPYPTAPPSVTRKLEEKSFEVREAMSAPAYRQQPDLLIWPECITIQRLLRDKLMDDHVRAVLHSFHGDFLLGSEETTGGKLYNDAYLLNPQRRLTQKYRKIFLIVLGEYLPWGDRFPWLRKFWGNFVSFSPGASPGCFIMPDSGVSFSPFICFEETQPLAGTNAARLHPDFFVTITNDGWYGGVSSRWIVTQQLQNAILRTVEHDRPLVRCANNGITCEIDSDGEIVARVAGPGGKTAGVAGVLDRRLDLFTPQVTPYEAWGDWMGALCRLVSVVAAACVWRRRAS